MNDTKTVAALIRAHATPEEAATAIVAFVAGSALATKRAERDQRRAYNKARQRRLRLTRLSENDNSNAAVAATESVSERSLKSESKISDKDSVAATSRDSAVEFAEFWKAYPRKAAKAAALKAWKKNEPPLAECLKALSWQTKAAGWTKDKGKFVPHPATWINGQRWLDEPTPGAYVPEQFREFVQAPKPIDRAALFAPSPPPSTLKNGHG